MSVLVNCLLPEIILAVAAGLLFLLGVSGKTSARRLAPLLALLALMAVMAVQSYVGTEGLLFDPYNTLRIYEFARYIIWLTTGIGVLLVLLAWPSNADSTGSSALNFGREAGEFYALMLLSIAGVFLVASANDIILLFLGLELVSIPTYVMVGISRPLPVAQEAAVKYFFLGAMSAAIMLFGFSYLYGTTGTIYLNGTTTAPGITQILAAQAAHGGLTSWQILAVVMLIAGFCFKIAAVPMHVYVGDVYQGAATPVTAFLSFIPKISGFVALLKILLAASGGSWHTLPPSIPKLICILAVLTMTFGNVLGLLQFNVKRVLACSSIAHSGYMLVGVAALLYAQSDSNRRDALQGIIFYLSAYGLMNIGAFGALILLPGRSAQPATSAESFEDLAGQGRRHMAVGMAMSISCFSLIGLPMTVGFFGKVLLIKPALDAGLIWLVVALILNAAISAAYYLKIVGALYLRSEPLDDLQPAVAVSSSAAEHINRRRPIPIVLAVAISMVLVLGFGMVISATQKATQNARDAAQFEPPAVITPNSTAALPAN